MSVAELGLELRLVGQTHSLCPAKRFVFLISKTVPTLLDHDSQLHTWKGRHAQTKGEMKIFGPATDFLKENKK